MPRSITFDRFEYGLDLRKGASVSDANRMRELTNAYITPGRAIRKRPGFTKVTTLESGTKGLIAGFGKLNTFYESGTVTHANSLFDPHKVAHPTTSQLVEKIHFGDAVNNYVYVAAEYADGSIWHHYLDGSSPTHIADANCPHSASVIKMANKIWAGDGDVVRFSGTNLPRDWTTSGDAGFLPVGMQQRGAFTTTALGQFRKNLVVFSVEGAQSWNVDPDPELHVLQQNIPGIGTNYPNSLSPLSGDLYFLGPAGYRSIALSGTSDNLKDVDVGSPIDDLVQPLLTGDVNPLATFYAGAGQYWCAIGQEVHVYTFSRTAKISAWSRYELPFTVDDFAELEGVLYLRSGDDVYKVDSSVYQDDGADVTMTVEMPFLNFQSPGMLKQVIGIDAVIQGGADLRFRWDAQDSERITEVVTLSGDTRPGEMTPMELTATSIAPVITSSANNAVQVDAITFYFNNLAPL